MNKICKKCGVEKSVSEFGKHPETRDKLSGACRACMNELQKASRLKNKYWDCKKYEKTKKGFLMRLYRNIKSRITGVQKEKFYLYEGKAILDKQVFYEWALNNGEFHRLFKEYEDSGYDRRLAPSVDRLKSEFGYELSNMEFVTHSVNSSRGASSVKKKKRVAAFKDGKFIEEFESLTACSKYIETSVGHISYVISGKLKHIKGYTFKLIENGN